mgnify:CR=1 FL=1
MNEADDFEGIYRGYVRQIYSFIYRIVGNRSDTEDLTSEVFFRFYKKRKHYEERGKMLSYLFRIAHNAAIDHFRRKKETISYDDRIAVDEDFDIPDTPEETAAERLEMLSAIERMKPVEREILTLYYLEEMSVKQICRIIGKNESAVKTALYRARHSLQKEVSYGK